MLIIFSTNHSVTIFQVLKNLITIITNYNSYVILAYSAFKGQDHPGSVTYCVTLGKLPNLSVPQFLRL